MADSVGGRRPGGGAPLGRALIETLTAEDWDYVAAQLAPRLAERLAEALGATPAPAERETVTLGEAAAIAGVSVATVRRAVRSGRLSAYRPGGTSRYLVERQELEDWRFGERAPVKAPADLSVPPSRGSAARSASAGSRARLAELERAAKPGKARGQ